MNKTVIVILVLIGLGVISYAALLIYGNSILNKTIVLPNGEAILYKKQKNGDILISYTINSVASSELVKNGQSTGIFVGEYTVNVNNIDNKEIIVAEKGGKIIIKRAI